MGYKLKKKITREDFINTVWGSLDNDQSKFLEELTKKIELFSFCNYNKVFISDHTLAFKTLEGRYKKMNFNDYFEIREDPKSEGVFWVPEIIACFKEGKKKSEDFRKLMKNMGINAAIDPNCKTPYLLDTHTGHIQKIGHIDETPLQRQIREISENCGFAQDQALQKKLEDFIKTRLERRIDGDQESIHYVHPEGSWNWAVEQMKNDHKVRDPSWQNESYYIYFNEMSKILDSEENGFVPSLYLLESNNWEIFEEKLTYILTTKYKNGEEETTGELSIEGVLELIKSSK